MAYLPHAFYHYNQCNNTSIGSGGYSEKKLSEIIINTNSIVDFLEQNRMNISKDDIMMLQLASKQTLLFTTDRNKFKDWCLLYPESNRRVMSYKRLPIHLRLLGWSSCQGLWPIVDFWIFLKKLKS